MTSCIIWLYICAYMYSITLENLLLVSERVKAAIQISYELLE